MMVIWWQYQWWLFDATYCHVHWYSDLVDLCRIDVMYANVDTVFQSHFTVIFFFFVHHHTCHSAGLHCWLTRCQQASSLTKRRDKRACFHSWRQMIGQRYGPSEWQTWLHISSPSLWTGSLPTGSQTLQASKRPKRSSVMSRHTEMTGSFLRSRITQCFTPFFNRAEWNVWF